jgi:hypothetical protein
MWSGQRSARGLLAKPTNRPIGEGGELLQGDVPGVLPRAWKLRPDDAEESHVGHLSMKRLGGGRAGGRAGVRGKGGDRSVRVR